MKQIIIAPANPDWPEQFKLIADSIRTAVGDNALRIDHIGSTAVPQLDAKDIIDIQITLANLNNADFIELLQDAGFHYREDITSDSLVGLENDSPQLAKRYFQQQVGERKAHIHIRQQGRLNQQYPLLFRDYLRADKVTRDAYSMVKHQLAHRFKDDIDAYYAIKDPYMDTIYQAAKLWATLNHWIPDDKFS